MRVKGNSFWIDTEREFTLHASYSCVMGSNANDTLKTVNEMRNHHLSFARDVQGLTGTTNTLKWKGTGAQCPVWLYLIKKMVQRCAV